MAISFVGAGSVVSGTGALSVPWPAGIAEDDFALLLLEANQSDGLAAPSGWTEVAGSPQSSVTYLHKLAVHYKLVGASESNVSVPDPGNHGVAAILVFRGVDTTNPINASAGRCDNAQATTIPLVGVTTTYSGCAIVHVAGSGQDASSSAQFSGWTNADLSSITEVIDELSNAGGGGGFGAAWGTFASSGTLSDGEVTQATTTVWSSITVALLPASGGGGVTGSLASTESGADTASLSGFVLIDGTLAASDSGADTASLSGDVLVSGALAASEIGGDTASISGGTALPAITGTLASTESSLDSASIAGNVLVDGALAASESGTDTAAFIGSGATPPVVGALAASESGADTAAVAGNVFVAGVLSAVDGGLDGFAVSGDIIVQGALAASESGADTAAFSNAATINHTENKLDVAAYLNAFLHPPQHFASHGISYLLIGERIARRRGIIR